MPQRVVYKQIYISQFWKLEANIRVQVQLGEGSPHGLILLIVFSRDERG